MSKLASNLVFCLVMGSVACGSNSTANIDADPNAPDADPNAPDADTTDADLTAPDARPVPDASAACNPVGGTPALGLQIVATGLQDPLFLVSPPGDPRQFVVEQPGRIRIIENGSLIAMPFLNIAARVNSNGNEQGLLGLAFHPDYANNGRFFVNYTASGPNRTVVAEYTVSNNPNVANTGETVIITINQDFSNHNGGMIAFSPNDGFLYIGMGDGGSGNDPNDRGQTTTNLLGSMLRLDVDVAAPHIPSTNPFVNMAGRDEIWAYGLRNPWRFSFDRLTGDLYIGDVGQNFMEEIDVQPANSTGGENYGWRIMEGDGCRGGGACNFGTLPVAVYRQDGNTPGYPQGGCSVTGGYVYRGCAMPGHHGKYFFADYCVSRVKSFEWSNNTVSNLTDWASLDSGGFSVSSFGEDADGELYIMRLGAGTVHKIVPQ